MLIILAVVTKGRSRRSLLSKRRLRAFISPGTVVPQATMHAPLVPVPVPPVIVGHPALVPAVVRPAPYVHIHHVAVQFCDVYEPFPTLLALVLLFRVRCVGSVDMLVEIFEKLATVGTGFQLIVRSFEMSLQTISSLKLGSTYIACLNFFVMA